VYLPVQGYRLRTGDGWEGEVLGFVSESTNLCTVSIVLPFLECCVFVIIQFITFSNWFMNLGFLHVSSWHDSSFPFSTK
jgi:hypothetical protein